MTTALALVSMLATHGCNLVCASAIIANFEVEVGPSLDPCTVGRSGIGWPQWAGTRRIRVMATLGKRWCEPASQLGHVVTELREMGLVERLFHARDPSEAARFFAREYERPRNRDYRNRMMTARRIYDGLTRDVVTTR